MNGAEPDLAQRRPGVNPRQILRTVGQELLAAQRSTKAGGESPANLPTRTLEFGRTRERSTKAGGESPANPRRTRRLRNHERHLRSTKAGGESPANRYTFVWPTDDGVSAQRRPGVNPRQIPIARRSTSFAAARSTKAGGESPANPATRRSRRRGGGPALNEGRG